jgi:hypothetical protein
VISSKALSTTICLSVSLIIFTGCNGGGSAGSESSPPLPPTGFTLKVPASSPGLDSTPTITTSGVVSGNTVRLFTDPSCTTEVGSAVSSGTSVDVSIGTALSVSAHNLYANTSNSVGTSPCSSVSVAYTLASCPTGFIPVPHNSDVGTNKDFCVMKYEAKNDGSDNAISRATGYPYGNLTATQSQEKCKATGSNYDLISNPEWMTIARNIETVSGNFEAGVLSRGWTGDPWANTGMAPLTDASCLYNTGADTCGSSGDHLYKRTLALTNNEVIWDFSGNAFDRVDWSHTTPGFQLSPITCDNGFVEFPVVLTYNCFNDGTLKANDVFPLTPNASSIQGFGQFIGGSNGMNGATNWGGAANRGGHWASGSKGGAFALWLYGHDLEAYTSWGFRCVYRL